MGPEGAHTSPPEQSVATGTIAELSKEMQIYSMGTLVGTHKFEPKTGLAEESRNALYALPFIAR